MGDNGTRHSQRAAAGLSKAIRREYVPPDTQVVGPDGTVRFLGRRSEALDPVISFQKYNPERRDARSGKRPKPGAAAGAAAAAAAAARRGGAGNALPFGRSARADGDGPLGGLLRGPMDFLNRVPFMHLVLTAALTHRVWTFVTRRLFGSGGGAAAAAAARNGDRQLAKRPGGGEDEEYDDDEYDLDERAEELLEQMQHASMLPTMLRAALPRPHRTSLAKRAAQQYHSRPRGYRTAHQMAHGGPAAPAGASGAGGGSGGRPAGDGAARRQAQRRPLGNLEKMDLIVRQQVRAAMLAQQRQQEQQLQQQLLGGALEAGPSAGARLALPGPAGVPSAAAAASSSAAAASAGRRTPLPPSPPPPYSNAGSGPLVPAAAAVAFPAPPHGLQLGPPPPPAFRPLPPELLARMQGVRHPRAAALAPAARAAAAGPPPAGLQDDQAASFASGGGSSAAATSAAAAAFESGAGVAVAGTGEASGRGQGQADAAASGAVAAVEGGSEDAEARPVVPRVARGVRSARKAEGQGNGSET